MHVDLQGKRVLVFGAGVSGIGADELLEKKGAFVTLYDGNTKIDEKQLREKLPRGSRADIVLGELPQNLLDCIDIAVISPGVPTDLPDVCRIKEAGIPLWGEIELAYACSRGDVLAITGTNGKTTTTTLLGEIMKYHNECGTEPKTDQVFVVGNIGTPYTQAALATTDSSVAVAEISSFQLETILTFHPKVSAITNITPDHLNRHHTMEEYIRVKERICENQTKEDTCVLNYEDEVLRSFGESLHVPVLFFSSRSDIQEGLCLNGNMIEYRKDGECIPVVSRKELHLVGLHNVENVMTAVGMALSYGVDMEEIRTVCRSFKAVEHRIEYVAEKGGVVYYNDSKGTNPDAAIKAVEAMERPTVLLAGGYDKDSSYEDWIRSFGGRVKAMVLIGATKEKIAKAARECGFYEIQMAESFEERFEICTRLAVPGDAVLLSPACASWGMFPNYEVRGRVFKDLVNALPGEELK